LDVFPEIGVLLEPYDPSELINCYWGTWANYRSGDGKFTPSNIDPFLCTHISYTFFGISDAGEFKSLDTWLDMDDGLGNMNLENIDIGKEPK